MTNEGILYSGIKQKPLELEFSVCLFVRTAVVEVKTSESFSVDALFVLVMWGKTLMVGDAFTALYVVFVISIVVIASVEYVVFIGAAGMVAGNVLVVSSFGVVIVAWHEMAKVWLPPENRFQRKKMTLSSLSYISRLMKTFITKITTA